jgi:hypothetical protein
VGVGGSPIFCSFFHNVLILNISSGPNVSDPFYGDKFSFLSCKSCQLKGIVRWEYRGRAASKTTVLMF